MVEGLYCYSVSICDNWCSWYGFFR